VGAQVFESESADSAAAMITDICERHGIDNRAIAPKLIATMAATAPETRKLAGSPARKKNLYERIH